MAALPAEEFAARRARVLDAIGSDAVAILQGAPAPAGFARFRQSNEFHYLIGVDVPHALALLDGRSRRCTLYLPGWVEGEPPPPAWDGAVAPPARLSADLAARLWRGPAPAAFVPLAPAEGAGATRDTLLQAAAAAAADPWDGGGSREGRFAALLRARFPQMQISDLTPVCDRLRLRKSPAELDLLRAAARLCGQGLLAAMAVTGPGVREYELEAAALRAFRAGGADGEGYCAIVAGGPRIWDAHYNTNDAELSPGELVLMDYAPDCAHYTSDIGRMWPVSGRYAPEQRRLYGFMVRYEAALLRRIHPGATAEDVLRGAAAEMAPVVEAEPWETEARARAARRALEFPGHLSHPVGMAVHDVGDYRGAALEPGLVFSVDPQLWVPEERLYVRVEDTVAVTADGVENLTGFVPREPEALERLLAER